MRKARRQAAILARLNRFGGKSFYPPGKAWPPEQRRNTAAETRHASAQAGIAHLRDAYGALVARPKAMLSRGDNAAEALMPRLRMSRDVDGPSLIVNLDGKIAHCSAEAARLLERDEQSLVGAAVEEVLLDLPLRRDTPGYNLAFADFNHRCNTWLALRFRDRQERRQPVEVSVRPLEIGLTHAFLIRLRPPEDDSGFREDLAQFFASEAGDDEGLAILNPDGKIVYANPAYEAMTGCKPGDAFGTMPRVQDSRLRKPEGHPVFRSNMSNGEAHYACVDQRSHGDWAFTEQAIRPVVNGRGRVTHFVGRLRTLGQYLHDRDQLVQMAYFDALTGLPNRNLFFDRLHQEISRAVRSHGGFTLLVLDIDHFKAVNDSLGHAAGDLLLQEVSARLRSCVRDSDTVARLGGDEFAIILTALSDQAHVIEVLKKIRDAVSSDFTVDGIPLPVSASIGVAMYPDHGEDDASLLKAADLAMYAAKRSKSEGWCFFGVEASSAPAG